MYEREPEDPVAGSMKLMNHRLVLLEHDLHFSHSSEEINTFKTVSDVSRAECRTSQE